MQQELQKNVNSKSNFSQQKTLAKSGVFFVAKAIDTGYFFVYINGRIINPNQEERSMSESQKSSCLLPNSVVPVNYDVQLQPDLENFTFNGIVSIEIKICEPVREITLHAVDLEIKSSYVEIWRGAKSSLFVPQEVRFDKEAQTATFVFGEEIPVGDAFWDIVYSGVLNDKMFGFYRSKYTTADGQTKYMATTQFEAADARRALPCWDEPACKATFDVALVVPKNLVALSNMPVTSVVAMADTDLHIVHFGRTPVMSTYLLAFVVGEFEYIEDRTNNGTLVRVYTLPGKTEQGRFALDVGKRSLEFYNDYFGIQYPLPKLDMITITEFDSGAMENWGLVTYRENALLIDGANSSVAAKQRVAEVVAHELAHMWFGNLVTMVWWKGLWLNEGFATWMANFVMDKLFPEWDIWTQFLADDCAIALSKDGLRSTHSIEVTVNNPDEINQIFDGISYSKGAGIIHMIHNFIGAEAFRNGMQIYLNRHAYSNAVTEDLWQALAEASGQPVKEIMDTWTKQPGYPLIKVTQHDEEFCVIHHKRFLAGGDVLTEEEAVQQWQIPMVMEFNHDGKSDYSKVIVDRASKVQVKGMDFVKLNSGQIALVRVNYLPEQWQALAEAVRNGKFGPADRYGLLNDALALTRAGHLPVSQLINLLSAYKNEENFTVCMTVLEALGALNSILEETPESLRFASFARSALGPITGKLGWTEAAEDTHSTKLLREPVLHAMGSYGDQDTIAEAKARFRNHASGALSADPNLRRAVYGITATYGDSTALHTMLDLYRKETFQEEKVRLLAALGRFVDPVSVHMVIQHAFNSGEVRHSDFIYVLAGMGSHPSGRRIAWKFVVDNWERVSERYGTTKMLTHIVSLVCGGFSRAEDAEVIERFFNDHPAPSATRAVAESLEKIRVKAAWYERDKDDIAAALKQE